VVAFCPLPQFFPTLSVLDDEDYPEAMKILEGLKIAPSTADTAWKCPQCGEDVPSHFSHCWNCPSAAEDQAG
jgi:predicted RNA-binding Zn-ribbon protein involved in translation (DUF1610 family)